MQTLKQIWEEGKDFEVEFWKKWVDEKGGQWEGDFIARLNPNTFIDPHIEEFIKDIVGLPSILDVGAGPLTVLGKKMSDGRSVHITAVDPLAEKYNQLFHEALIRPLVITQYAEVEKLDMFFHMDQFDLVHMRNALDHSYDPLLGVRQMIATIKPKRVILLEHSTNEAEKAKYGAFHQWNICVEDDCLIFWNKSNRINVNKELENIAKVIAWGNDEWTSAVIEKNA
ncbi:MAG TPA: methyltransferase domain-containing protein [Chitinophagaceae bacterium]